MASAQQATFAAQKGVNWADPNDPNFGKAGYIGQSDYDAYNQQYGGASTPGQTSAKPIDQGPLTDNGSGSATHQPPAQTIPFGTPGAQTAPQPAPIPTSAPTQGTAQQPPPGAVDPFAASGGGVYLGGGQWVPKNSPLAGTAGTPSPAPTTPGAPAPGTTPTTGTGTGQIPGTPDPGTGGANGDFMNTLLGLLHPGAIDQNDPRISGAIAANNLALQRGAEAQRAQQAEVNAQTGTDASGGANTTNQGILEDMAAKQGQFAGGEVQHLGDIQNQQTLAAIGALGSYLPQQEQIANQWAEHEAGLSEQAREFDVDSALKKLGITTQGNLGQADLALRDKIASSQSALQLLGILTQMQEFGAGLDNQTILSLLGSVG